MQIKYQNIILRDMRESDIEDDIRWNTTETAWRDWDAPWETEEALRAFDPEKYRQRELAWIAKPKPDHRMSLEIETAEGVHIGGVNAYTIDGDFNWMEKAPEGDPRAARWAVGIDLCESAFWSGGWGTRALTAFVRYHLEAGYTDLYTQTWSGNIRMIGLAEKLGFRECRRKVGIREVRGVTYDGLTFRLDRAAFARHCRSMERLELHVPSVEDMAFAQRMQADPATMAYNAGWDVCYPGYHPDTGCIDFPASEWADRVQYWVGQEPKRSYALVREKKTGAFVGEVNFHYTPSENWHDMGVVVHAPFRGLGYGDEALALLCRHAFEVCGIEKLHNSFEEDRDPGLAIHRRAGFRQVGESTAIRFGKEVRLLELELTREDYLARLANFQ